MGTQTDPSRSALLVLHYQNGLVRHEGVFAFSGTPAQIEKHNCLEKTAAVLAASREAGSLSSTSISSSGPGSRS